MRNDGATTGRHVVIWSFVTITQSFRLHFQHLKLHSGKSLTKLLNFNQRFAYLGAQTTPQVKTDTNFSQMIFPIQNDSNRYNKFISRFMRSATYFESIFYPYVTGVSKVNK